MWRKGRPGFNLQSVCISFYVVSVTSHETAIDLSREFTCAFLPISVQSLIIFTVRKANTDKSEELIFMKKQRTSARTISDVLIMFTRGLTSRIIFRDHFKSSGGNIAGDPLHEGETCKHMPEE